MIYIVDLLAPIDGSRPWDGVEVGMPEASLRAAMTVYTSRMAAS